MKTSSQIFIFCLSIAFSKSFPVKNTSTCGFWDDDSNISNSSSPSFPWLLAVSVVDEESILCSGSAISQFSAILAASCLVGFEDKPLTITVPQSNAKFQIDQIVLHQRFDQTKGNNLYDVAIVHIREDSPGFSSFACLPDLNDDPVGDCKETAYISPNESKENKLLVVSSPISFGPSIACLERRELKDVISSDEASVLCNNQPKPCLDYGSQIYCASPESKSQLTMVGFGSYGSQFCSAGAYVRIARYAEWIQETIQKLEGQTIQSGIQVTISPQIFLNTSDPCASMPCGLNAVCWNSGSRFMCTCDEYFPHGNPIEECSKCLQDSHCSQGSKCIDKQCLETQISSEISSEYVKTANGNYIYVSQEELPWPRAQYECLSRKGYLAELSDISDPEDSFLNILRSVNTTGSFWIGASDFEERGTFKWYYSGKQVSSTNWPENMIPNTNDDDDRCLQVNLSVGGKWSSHNCSSTSRFICTHVLTENEKFSEGSLVGNSVSFSSSATIRTERQQNFDTLNPSAHYASVCGRRFVRPREGRIVGGEVAPYGQWPWQVSLRQYKNGQYRHKCGAALLTHEWIITAAHCVKDVSPSNLLVRIGEYNVLDTSEAHKHINRRISRVIIHNGFDKASYEYDIALLRVDENVLFQPNIVPICLPESDSDLVGEQGWVTGWGRKSEYGQISPILREVNLPIISNAKCMALYKVSGQNEWIPRIFLCAGTPNGGQDSCEGDSGGPLTIKGRNGRFQLAGIISWGIGCGDRNRPGVYTRISEFRSWIKKNSNYEDFKR